MAPRTKGKKKNKSKQKPKSPSNAQEKKDTLQEQLPKPSMDTSRVSEASSGGMPMLDEVVEERASTVSAQSDPGAKLAEELANRRAREDSAAASGTHQTSGVSKTEVGQEAVAEQSQKLAADLAKRREREDSAAASGTHNTSGVSSVECSQVLDVEVEEAKEVSAALCDQVMEEAMDAGNEEVKETDPIPPLQDTVEALGDISASENLAEALSAHQEAVETLEDIKSADNITEAIPAVTDTVEALGQIAVAPPLQKDDVVEADFLGMGYQVGKITNVHPDKSYDIQFHHGAKEVKVSAKKIRKPTATLNTHVFEDLSRLYLRDRQNSALRQLNEESQANPKPSKKPSAPNGPPSEEEKQPETFEVGDEVMTQFGRGKVEEVKDGQIVVKTTDWKMDKKQPATLYLQPSAVTKAEPKKSYELNDEEKLDKAASLKEEGNQYFRRGGDDSLGQAILSYSQAVSFLQYVADDISDDLRAQKVELMITTLNNYALCHFKLKKYSEAEANAQQALKLSDLLDQNRDGKIMKALLKNGISEDKVLVQWRLKSMMICSKALKEKNEYEDAIKMMKRGIEIAKGRDKKQCNDFQALLRQARNANNEAKKKQQKMWQKAINKLPEEGEAQKNGSDSQTKAGSGTKKQDGKALISKREANAQKRKNMWWAVAGVTAAAVGVGALVIALNRKKRTKENWSAFVSNSK
mmetsp:Transcript_30253/g.39044  ORF Transcript_30253/g.39044 Transcript_30253/m.39044 type:complete len:696 (+) Transcript_30253:398-2485(+)